MNALKPIGVIWYVDIGKRHDVSAYYGRNKYGEGGKYIRAIDHWFAIDKQLDLKYKFRDSEIYETA